MVGLHRAPKLQVTREHEQTLDVLGGETLACIGANQKMRKAQRPDGFRKGSAVEVVVAVCERSRIVLEVCGDRYGPDGNRRLDAGQLAPLL